VVLAMAFALAPLPARGQTCLAPSLEVEIAAVTAVTAAPPGIGGTLLHLDDPNPAERVSGYNVYRSSNPALPRSSWSLLAVDAVDEQAAPLIQVSDATGSPPARKVWFYLATGYNGACATEGPWRISTDGDIDWDGVGEKDDACPTTPEGAELLMTGCSAADLLLRPEVLTGPIRRGVDDFLAGNAGVVVPDEVATPLGRAQTVLDAAFEDLRDASPCPAAASLGSAAGYLTDALQGIDDYLAQLVAGAASAAPPHPEGAPADYGTEGRIIWPSAEVLHWQDQRYALSLLLADAVEASGTGDRICSAEGPLTTISGRVRSISDEERLVLLENGQRIVMSWTAAHQGPDRMAEDAEVGVEGNAYGPVIAGKLFDKQASTFPFTYGLLYDGCLQLRLLPVQPLGWGRKHLDAYIGATGRLELEAGMKLIAEDLGCPGILPGSGPSGTDVRLDYFYDVTLDYQPQQGSFVTGAVLAQEMDGNSFAVSFPAMNPAIDGALTVTKYKRTCTDSGTTIPIIDPVSGNPVGSMTLWNCSAEQIVQSDTYPVRVRDPQAYCSTTYDDTLHDLEDHEPESWSWAVLDSATPLPGVPGSVVVYAYGDTNYLQPPMQHDILTVGFDFLVYNQFAPYQGGLGTNHKSSLDWPHMYGERNDHEFRYTCGVPEVVTDLVPTGGCGSFPNTFYRLPFPQGVPTLVHQGNWGSLSHNGWQAHALDLSGNEGDPLRAARGGTVVKVRKDMTGNCATQPCPNLGFPMLDAYGNHVAIQHMDGTVAWYTQMAHNSSPLIVGQKMKRGDYIGDVGNTGTSNGPHLHFHVTPANPANWGNITLPVRFEAYDFPQYQLQTCLVPQQGQSYVSTNRP